MIGAAAALGAVLVLVVLRGWRRSAARPAQPASLDPVLVARAIREDEQQARLARLRHENAQLAELASLRFELLRLACRAHGLSLTEKARDTEPLQALRAVALQHEVAARRMGHELAVRDDALAALGALALREQVEPGQYSPDELVRRVAAHERGARGGGGRA